MTAGADTSHIIGNGSIVAERWQIVRPIARGGMGSVFEAKHTLSRKTVALKVLDVASAHNERHLVRFQREVSIRAEVGHEGIVDVLDAGIDNLSGRPFVAMEMLSGEDMRDRMDKPGTPREPLFRAVRQMLDPLAAAHAHGVVHRDLKPENVFLAKQPDGSERVKLLDFGIAVHREGQRATMQGVPMGTPNYMSPEQTLDAASVNDRADSWSVGVMLFELASGRTPYVASTPQEVFALAISQPAPTLLSVAPHAPPRLAALVDACLSREADKRPDVRTIAAELDAIFPPVPIAQPGQAPASFPGPARVSAPVVPATRPTPKRSSLTWIACVGVLGFLVLGGSALGYYAYVRVKKAAQDEAAVAEAAAARIISTQTDPLAAAGIVHIRSGGGTGASSTTPRVPNAAPGLGPSRFPAPMDAPIRPTPTGPLVVQIVSNFQCPPCMRNGPLVASRLAAQYPSAIRFAFRHYPDPTVDRAMPASEAALEVRAQAGDAGFWAFYDRMVTHAQAATDANQQTWDLSDATLVRIATSIPGIDGARLTAALRDHRHQPRIEQDIDALDRYAGGLRWSYGQRYGVPTFIVHGVTCWPANQLDLFRAVDQAVHGQPPQACSYQ